MYTSINNSAGGGGATEVGGTVGVGGKYDKESKRRK